MPESLSWINFITLVVAVVGAVLGVLNTWRAINADRVRLRVRPAYVIGSTGQTMFSIEVVNLSTFALTISEVGFSLDRGGVKKAERAVVTTPIIIDGKPWPRRLEARESVSVFFDLQQVIGSPKAVHKAYARTSCGEVRYGDSPALRQLRDMMKP